MNGGEFTFIMGKRPNKQLGSNPKDYPPTDNGRPVVTVPWLESGDELFETETLIRLVCDTKDAQIFYTLDGSEPDRNSNLYEKPIRLTKTVPFKMRAFKKGMQPSLIISYNFQKAKYLPAVRPAAALNRGLHYRYYESYVVNTPDLKKLGAPDSGICSGFNIDKRKKDSFFAFNFKGLLKVPVTGLYTFYLESNDGSRLFIDGDEVIENDGAHIAKEEVGKIGLQAGYHRIEVNYFQRGGGKKLKVSWQRPGIDKQEIPEEILFNSKPFRF